MVGEGAKNHLNRRFATSHALQKIVTDVTEVKYMNDEKLYLSPMMDLYNGEIIGFSISKLPTLHFALESIGRHEPDTISNTCQPISCVIKTLNLRVHYPYKSSRAFHL